MILYYSGTGNSAHAAKRIADITGDTALNLFDRIRSGDCSPIESDRCWIIVCPTYAWRMPRVVERLLERTELLGSRDVYFILTCGDSIGNAGAYARRLCERKGLHYRGIAKIVMPENYIAMFNAPDEAGARRIVEAAGSRIEAAAQAILADKSLPDEKICFADRFISGPVNPIFYALFVKDRKFYAKDSCIGCGLCERLCPMNNIKLSGGRPVWQGSCTHCMACICSCPEAAIEYGKISAGKPRYKCPED